jgi:tRNA(Ile)-lysidine synthase TilS/MesJ
VRRTLDDAAISLVGRRVLALCSGGADSVLLVAALGELPRGAAPASIDVLFCDHALRGDIAAERAAARAVAEHVGARMHERRCDRSLLDADGGIEAAARTWRLEAAGELAAELGCDVVATGHTASDQVEAALLSIAGVTGRPGELHAMPVARELDEGGALLVRPLLGLDRATSIPTRTHATPCATAWCRRCWSYTRVRARRSCVQASAPVSARTRRAPSPTRCSTPGARRTRSTFVGSRRCPNPRAANSSPGGWPAPASDGA